MGGPWKDRGYVPSNPQYTKPTTPDLSLVSGFQLGTFLNGLAIGLLLGAAAMAWYLHV